MKEQPSRQALAENIKREILMDLDRTYGRQYQERDLIDSVKKEVLRELDPRYRQFYHPDRTFVEAVKNEVLAQLREESRANQPSPGGSAYLDRETIESIKRDVIAQVKAVQEDQEEHYAQARGKTVE